jgi:NAD(P)-dependent dehydrogenase (short-subunit alcohol dehydrogenase family)
MHAFFTDTSEADWRRLLCVNLEAAFAFTLHALPPMQKARYGRIVNVGSEAARLGSKGGSIYAAAKAGLMGFTKSIARENARYGITANVVSPGPVLTPMVELGRDAYGERIIKAMEELTLMKRLGEPQEVAAAVAFLASREASFITGEVLGVSGGMGCGAS